MLSTLTTTFIGRLKARDEAAWFELWETFGPVLRAQLTKWGRGRIGAETARDLSQETLAALSDSLDRYDPARGARFSTWLLAIAKHVLGDEMDRRNALKRGGGKPGASLDETWMVANPAAGADEAYEAAVFRAKVEAAIKLVERDCDFTEFSIYRMRVFDGRSGKEVAEAVGVSEPTISRRLAKVRDLLRTRIAHVVATYSFTEEELREASEKGLSPGSSGANADGEDERGEPAPTKEQLAALPSPVRGGDRASDAEFDDCLAEIYHQQMELRASDDVLTGRAVGGKSTNTEGGL